ncbi:O-antigen exporter ATP-binding protein [Neokomagataea thailandica NBRC 106555]|uniref:ABC transporter ATP-binding protein n=2 Tax=Neokomagataea TaxID=1223423 RepID=A0A4Y6V9B7_9PROT|nr:MULTISPECIES: ABC transporter ATP-binding protein [Neokomagataea]QDH25096.1 ABC transporter ATP-binding protein [Neokomagataea tanensis]GBR54200.1 O-antigen exporter ATP-binding protein [Neokomagataea thailandica NBRC 106555]
MPQIEATDVYLEFPLYHAESRLLKKRLASALQGKTGGSVGTRFAQDARSRTVVDVLRGIDFTAKAGDRIGLIGRNGAGKTTLLRALAGIYEPVRGEIVVRGTMGALLDASLGMNPELTGRENVRLFVQQGEGDLSALDAAYDDVQDFAELGHYFDLPIKTYSSGMAIRLAFAMATTSAPQILLMDEWFLAGDGVFLKKAETRLKRLIDKVEILVVSSHQPEILARWCNRVIWMEQGQIRADGPCEDTLQQYKNF